MFLNWIFINNFFRDYGGFSIKNNQFRGTLCLRLPRRMVSMYLSLFL